MHVITKYELRVILKVCGYSKAAFARYTGRSEAYISRLCWRLDLPIPLRYVHSLGFFLGEEVLETALPIARKMIAEAREKQTWC